MISLAVCVLILSLDSPFDVFFVALTQYAHARSFDAETQLTATQKFETSQKLLFGAPGLPRVPRDPGETQKLQKHME